MPAMLQPIGRPSFWRKTSCFASWSIGGVSVALVMASCMGIEVYRDTTSRLHGYGSILLVARMHLMSSRLYYFNTSRASSYFDARLLYHIIHFYSYLYLVII